LGNGLLLEMSMEPESPLRAGPEKYLSAGTKFRVIALDASDKLYSYADYTVPSSGAGAIPTDAGFELHVKSGTPYYFVCISYNSTTALPPATSYTVGSTLPALTVDMTKDLLWWKTSATQTLTSSEDEVPVLLAQQLTKIKLELDCSYNSWTITSVSGAIKIASVAEAGTFNLAAGTFSGSTGEKTFSGWTSPVNATKAESSLRVVFPQASGTVTFTIPAGAITRQTGSALPASAQTLTLSNFVLEKGKSYTFRLRIRSPLFADSNIYWDVETNRLKFDPYTTSPSLASQQKQGVMFKWGSLIGISCAGVQGVAMTTSWDENMAIYVPTSHTNWTKTTIPAAQSLWSSWSGTGYAGIPYVTAAEYVGPTTDDRNNNYLTTLEAGSYKGDICHYLDEGYRMPTIAELITSTTHWTGSLPKTNANPPNEIATNIYGTTLISSPRGLTLTTSSINGMFFPASGYQGTNGGFVYVGTGVFYWSSSCYSTNAFNLVGGNYNRDNRLYGFAVRCVPK
jgi:hypothetical protein